MGGFAGLPGSTAAMPAEVSYYKRMLDDIRARIASGEWPPGRRIPPTRDLLAMYGESFGVRSASTVRRVVEVLIETGELRGHQGVGVYVAGDATE